MNTKDYEIVKELTAGAKAAIRSNIDISTREDRVVGVDRDGSLLYERTVKTEVKHAAKLGFDSIMKYWLVAPLYLKELESCGFTAIQHNIESLEISWR